MLQPGHLINDTYRVEKLLGSGGMADVYLVAHTRLPRKFALKVMHLEQGTQQAFLERFNREGEILASIRHPHIVDVMDRNQLPDGNPYLVMELLEGEDLSTFLARTGPLMIPVALRICSQIGDALEAAHKVGVVHRDLKPSNIFLSKEGHILNFVKVLDFGIAKMTARERTPMTAPAALMGTPAYMSPEQALGSVNEIDARTDQFALAAVLYEMLTGKGAFYQPGDVIYAILERVVRHDPEPLRDSQLNRAVMRALSKKPEQRFPTLREFLAAVGATTHTVYSQQSIVPNAPGTLSSQISERSPRPGGRLRRVATAFGLGGGGAAVVMGLFVAVLQNRSNTTPPQPPPVIAVPFVPPKDPPAVAATLIEVESTAQNPVEKTDPHPQAPQVPIDTSDSPSPPDQPNPDRPPTPDPAKVSQPPKPGWKSSPRFVPTGRKFVLIGPKNSSLEAGVLACANAHLLPLRLPDGTSIKLERSGTLAVVDGPAAVFNTGINACLRQTLTNVAYQLIPQAATLRLTK